jgi:hypothetical protein
MIDEAHRQARRELLRLQTPGAPASIVASIRFAAAAVDLARDGVRELASAARDTPDERAFLAAAEREFHEIVTYRDGVGTEGGEGVMTLLLDRAPDLDLVALYAQVAEILKGLRDRSRKTYVTVATPAEAKANASLGAFASRVLTWCVVLRAWTERIEAALAPGETGPALAHVRHHVETRLAEILGPEVVRQASHG